MRASAWKVLVAALVIGIDADRLLHGSYIRLGFALWIVSIAVCLLAIGGRGTREYRLVLGGTVLAAFGTVWRDAPLLYTIDLLSVLCMGALAVWLGSGRRIADLTVIETARAGVLAVINTISGAAGVLADAVDAHRGREPGEGRTRPLVLGALLAAPPVLIVASLLASSDKVFDGVLSSAVSLFSNIGFAHLPMILFFSWLAAGWLRGVLGNPLGRTLATFDAPSLRFASVAVGLYSLIVLLAAFIITQARVLFGGAAYLRATQGMSVATYARDGFFQLIAAAAVVLLTLVMAEWCLDEDDASGRRRYRQAATTLIVMVGVLLISSAVRIGLYVNEFGLSVDRSFASAAIIWVAAALVAFASTTLRGAPGKFMPVTLLCTIGWVMAVNLANPEAIIVRVNVARAVNGAPFDAAFHGSLSADALPALLATAPDLAPELCAALEFHLRSSAQLEYDGIMAQHEDWRAMDLPRYRLLSWRESGGKLCPVAPAVRTAPDSPPSPTPPSPDARM